MDEKRHILPELSRKLYTTLFPEIPESEREAFRKNLARENAQRLPLITGILLLVGIFLLVSDVYLSDVYSTITGYDLFFTIDSVFLAIIVVQFTLSILLNPSSKESVSKLHQSTFVIGAFFFVGWAGIVSGIEHVSGQGLATLVLACFYTGALAYFSNLTILLVFSFGIITLGITGTVLNPDSVDLMLKQYYVIPSMTMAWFISRLLYRNRALLFLKQHTLEVANMKLEREIEERRQTEARLEEVKAELEESILRRNEDLANTRIELNEEIRRFRESETKRRELNHQLERAQRMEAVGRLAGGIAHDFNNLLTTIIGSAEVAHVRAENDDKVQKPIDDILDTAMHAAELTRQLLTFSRRQASKPSIVNLSQVVENLERLLTRIIGEDIKLKTELDSSVWSVKADPVQLEQVIVNLAVNARDAMPNGGTVTISVHNRILSKEDATLELDAGDYVSLSVRDTGIGIDDSVRDQIFDPFFTTKEEGKGTGLGLSTVYGIVKQSKGEILVHSLQGKGTTFHVLLPRALDKEIIKSNMAENDGIPTGTETILVVEDEDSVRAMIRKTLTRFGYRVEQASDGLDALSKLQRSGCKPDLMLTDIVMPEIDGIEAAQRAREICPKLKIIFMTGYSHDFDKQLLETGFVHKRIILRKPFLPRTLGQVIREVLDNKTTVQVDENLK